MIHWYKTFLPRGRGANVSCKLTSHDYYVSRANSWISLQTRRQYANNMISPLPTKAVKINREEAVICLGCDEEHGGSLCSCLSLPDQRKDIRSELQTLRHRAAHCGSSTAQLSNYSISYTELRLCHTVCLIFKLQWW